MLSTLVATFNFSNYPYIHVAAYLLLAFGLCNIVVLLANITAFRNHVSFRSNLNLPDLLVLVWVLYYLISFILSSKYNNLPDCALIMLILFITYFYIRSSLKFEHGNRIINLFYIIIFLGSIEAIYGILQLLDILPNIFQFKLGGSFGNPGDLANLLALTYIISLGLYFYTRGKRIKYLLIIATVLQFIVICISYSRTAWIASFCISIAIIWNFKFKYLTTPLLIERVKKDKFIWTLGLSAFLILCIVGVIVLYNLKTSSADGRVFMNKLSKELILEKPLFGHGYNSFYSVQHQKQIEYFKHNPSDTKNGWLVSEVVFAFNDYYQFTIEFGCVFLILLLILFWSLLSFKEAKMDNDKEYSQLLFIGRMSLGSILICMLFSYPLQNPTILLCFFILLAIISTFDRKILLKIRFAKKTVFLLTLIVFIFSNFILYYSALSIIDGLKWKHAFNNFTKNPRECVLEYASINRFMKHDIIFVQDYGSIFFQIGEYDKCISYYEENMYMCQTTEILLMLGQSYEELKNFKKAESSYRKASCLVPHKFIPKYRLFKLYQNIGDYVMAERVAKEIRDMKIKVFSNYVKDIKTEANKYLSSQGK